MQRFSLVLAMGALLFVEGCASSYDVLGVESRGNSATLALAGGTPLREGEILNIVGPLGGAIPHDAAAVGHAQKREILGRVMVKKRLDATHVLVEVLSGSVAGGVTAEPVQ